MFPPRQQSSGRVIVGQSHSSENSAAGTGGRKGVEYPFCIKCGQNTLGTVHCLPSDALCAEEKVIGGGIASI